MTPDQKPKYEWCGQCGERLHPAHQLCDVCNEQVIVKPERAA